MAVPDLLFSIFVIPRNLTYLYVNYKWLISGPLGRQVLCKLYLSLMLVSTFVSIQSLLLITVDRFVAVVFPFRSPIISSKLCHFYILATWIVAMAAFSPTLFALKLVENPGKLACEWRWNEAFGESSSVGNYFLALYVVFYFIPIALLVILYSIIVFKLKSQKIPGEQSANAEQQRVKRN